MKIPSKLSRYSGVIVLVILMIYFGFKRERYLLIFSKDSIFTFIRKYPRLAPTDYQKEMGGMLGFNFSPKLTSAILFSLVYLIITSAIIQLVFRKWRYTKITASIFAIYIVLCFVLIQLGALGVDYRLSVGLSHYLEDLFLSPFPLMVLIPGFIIAEKMEVKS